MVAVRDLYIAPDGSFVRIATFGRGVWEIGGSVVPGPTINVHPANVTVLAGQAATFSVVATGTGTLSYQWRRNAVVIPGATSASYVTPPTVVGDTGIPFAVNVTDSTGSTLSNSGLRTVTPCGGGGTSQMLLNQGFESGNTIWTVSNNDIINPSSVANMQVRSGTWGAWMSGYGVVNTDTLSQDAALSASSTHVELNFWLKIGTNETGGVANDTLKVQIRNTSGGVLGTLATLSNLDAPAHATFVKKTFDLTSYAGQTIRIYFEGQENSSLATSFFLDDFELNVTSGSSATIPAITTHPASQSVSPGQSASFSVVATGTPPLYYQWRKDGTVIPTATNSTFSIASAQAGDAGAYTGLVSNCAGYVTSNPATLTVTSATQPTITTQPQSQPVTAGQSTTFNVVSTGSPTIIYQWPRKWSNVSGATARHTFTATLADNAAQYSVFVSNGSNATSSTRPDRESQSRDLNGDGRINVLDITTLMAAYSGSGVSTSNCRRSGWRWGLRRRPCPLLAGSESPHANQKSIHSRQLPSRRSPLPGGVVMTTTSASPKTIADTLAYTDQAGPVSVWCATPASRLLQAGARSHRLGTGQGVAFIVSADQTKSPVESPSSGRPRTWRSIWVRHAGIRGQGGR